MVRPSVGPDDSLSPGTAKTADGSSSISFPSRLFDTTSRHHKDLLLHLLNSLCGDFTYSHTMDQETLHPVHPASPKQYKFQ
jgi:hypothetical protein